MASDRPMAMMPRREITTGPESFRSSASSVRMGARRPPATEEAWAAGRSMTVKPGFQRGADPGACVKNGKPSLAGGTPPSNGVARKAHRKTRFRPYGRAREDVMAKTIDKRVCAEMDGGFVVFMIGMRVN